MGNRRNAHAYNADEIERVKGIPLPEKIKCGRCQKNVPQTKFSAKQLTDARIQVRDYGRIQRAISCKSCTGQQVTELECIMCYKTKGLEEFAKSQRNKPDSAKCFACMETQVNEEAISEKKYKDPEAAFVTPDYSNGRAPEYFSSATSTTGSEDDWSSVNGDGHKKRLNDDEEGGSSIVNAMHGLGFNTTNTDTLIDTGDGISNGREAWNEVRAKSWRTQSQGTTSATTPSSSNKYGGRPSAPSASGSFRSFGSSQAERSNASEYSRSGFVKKSAISRGTTPSAWIQGGPMRPMGDARREYEDDVEDEEKEGSGDAWSSDDDEETEI